METLIVSSPLRFKFTRSLGLLLFVLTLASAPSHAITTVVKGQAPTLIKAPLSVMKVDDFISGQRTRIYQGSTDILGYFECAFDIEETSALVIHIEGTVASIIVEPGETYQFIFPGIARKDPQTFNQMKVELEYDRDDTENINVWIASYNAKYDFFFERHYPDIIEEQYSGSSSYVRSRRSELAKARLIPAESADSARRKDDEAFLVRISGFEEMQQKMLGEKLKNTYFSDYVNYSLATSRLMAGGSKEEVFKAHFADRPARPGNPEYVTAVQQMFPGFLLETVFADELDGIKKTYIVERNPRRLDSLLSDLPMLFDEDLRWSMLLINLNEAFYNSRMDRNIPLRHLQRIAANPDHFGWAASVAEGLVERMTFGKRGMEMPEFTMVNDENEPVNLSDLKGKFLYVQFLTSWCRQCPDHMELMNKLYQRYGKDIEMVTVGMDHRMEDFVAYRFEYPDYEWTWIYGPSEGRVMDLFQLQSIPQYYLIDPEGKIALDHVGAPDKGALGRIEKQIISWRKTHQ